MTYESDLAESDRLAAAHQGTRPDKETSMASHDDGIRALLRSVDSHGALTAPPADAGDATPLDLVALDLAHLGRISDPVVLNHRGRAALAEVDPGHPAVRSL